MNRAVLLGAGVAVLAAAGVALYLGTRSGDDATPAASPSVPDSAPATGSAKRTSVSPAPGLRADPGPSGEGGDGTTSYKVDSVTVHDHRGSGNAPLDVPPNVHPPGYGRRIPPTLTGAFASQVRTVLADCAKSLPAESRGPRPHVEGEIIIAITGGKASLTRTLMQIRDVTGDTAALQQCLEQKTIGLTADATGQDDLDGYSIHVQFPILQ